MTMVSVIAGCAIKQPDWTNDIIQSTGTNGPSSPGLVNIYYRRSIVMWSYSSEEMLAAIGKSSATITGIRFFVTEEPFRQPLPNYAIGMKNGVFGSSNPGTTGYSIVSSPTSQSFVTGETKTINFNTSFEYTGQDLAFVFAWGQCPIDYQSTGQTPTGNGTMYYNWSDNAGSYVINSSAAPSLASYRPVVQISYR